MTKNNLDVGDIAPDFTLLADGGGEVSLQDFRGKQLVIYFYPKDDTPGCTSEAIDFSAQIDIFGKANTEVVGVSADSVAKHEKFKAKHDLRVQLLSDESLDMVQAYGVWVEKNMYGRKYMGIERASFLLDETGVIKQIWRKVRVKGHVAAVLDAAMR